MAGSNVPGRLKPVILGAAKQYGIRPGDLAGLLDVESNFSSHSSSSAGAVGIAQFLPSTARSMGVDPYNDRSAIYGAAKYLRSLGYSKDRLRALGAYNGGPGNPQYGYAHQVVSRGSQLAGQLGGVAPASSGGGQQQPGVNTQTTKTVTPGVDNSAQRQALMYQYLSAPKADPFSTKNLQPTNVADPVKAVSQLQSQGPDLSKTLAKAASGSNSLLSLAGNLQQAQDIPGVTKTVVQRQQAQGGGSGGGTGYRHPIPGASISSHDNGADFETNPGTPLRAVGSGVITDLHGAFTPSGSIVLKLDHPYHGQRYVYYGHLQNGNKEVQVGQRVGAGQILARSSRRPDGAENMPGHVEIGFANGPNGGIETGGAYQGNRSIGSSRGALFSRFLSGLH